MTTVAQLDYVRTVHKRALIGERNLAPMSLSSVWCAAPLLGSLLQLRKEYVAARVSAPTAWAARAPMLAMVLSSVG